jgi:hypothetical protein
LDGSEASQWTFRPNRKYNLPTSSSSTHSLINCISTVAVVRGAVVRRIEETHTAGVYMVECPMSYGITMSQPYSSYLHDKADAYRDPFDAKWKARDQMVWLIKKGDVLLSSQPTEAITKFCRRFSLNDPKLFATNLVAYDGTVEGNDPQQRKQRYALIPAGNVKRHCMLEI